jgi:hypothetical protein
VTNVYAVIHIEISPLMLLSALGPDTLIIEKEKGRKKEGRRRKKRIRARDPKGSKSQAGTSEKAPKVTLKLTAKALEIK